MHSCWPVFPGPTKEPPIFFAFPFFSELIWSFTAALKISYRFVHDAPKYAAENSKTNDVNSG